jgi:hypothetical protein
MMQRTKDVGRGGAARHLAPAKLRNMIQLDWLSQTAAALIALPAGGRTYNLTHPNPVNFRDLIHASFEALGLSNVTLVEDKDGWTPSPVKLAVRRLVHRELDHLRPYLLHATRFESRNLYPDLGLDWPQSPITPAFIRMTMQ